MTGKAYYDTIAGQVAVFSPISLDEMDGVKLMDRTDVKYALSFDQLKPVLSSITPFYRVLTIKEKQVFNYRTDYYDTPDLDMFLDHHNGKLNRFKIRHREYVESCLNFLEVKFKSNKGRVVKERIKGTPNDHHAFTGFVTRHTPYDPETLNLSIVNHFNRFTLVDKQLRERVTVDFNLAFHKGDQHMELNGLVIVEVKQNKRDKTSNIFDALKSQGIRPASVSKYCLGIALLKQYKANNFKKTLLMINKLSHVELSA